MSATDMLSATLATTGVPHLIIAEDTNIDPKVTIRIKRLLDLTERGQIRWVGKDDLFTTYNKDVQCSVVAVGFGDTPDGYSLDVNFISGSLGDPSFTYEEVHSSEYPLLAQLFKAASEHTVPESASTWPYPKYSNMADALSGLLSGI